MGKLSFSVLSFLLLFCFCFSLSSQQGECQINNIDARESSYTVRSEGGETEFWDNRNDEFQCAGVSIRRHRIHQRGLLLPVYHNAPVLSFFLAGNPNNEQEKQQQYRFRESRRTSAIRGMPVDVVANAYQVSREEAERLKFSRQETIIFAGSGRSGRGIVASA